MDHPVVKQIETWGYPSDMKVHEYVMTDTLKNEIYTGDEYYKFDGEIYLKEALSDDAIQILEIHGAELEEA